jgi:hypothetical protein
MLFSPVAVPLTTLVAVSQHICTPFSAVPLFSSGSILMELFTVFIGDGCHVFWGKDPNLNAKNEVSMTRYTAPHYTMKFAAAQIHCNFTFCIADKVSVDVFKCLPGSSFCRI